MNRLFEQTLSNRGLTPADLVDMETVSDIMLKDIDTLCAFLHDCYAAQSHIVLLSDFDMDGIMCGVIGFAGLCELGFHVSLYQPDVSAGYGFDEADVDRILRLYPDASAILTADVGIECHSGIAYAKQKGLQVFVTDHHIQKSVVGADCIVDPQRMDEVYPNKSICGAFVLYQTLLLYAKTYCSCFLYDQISRLAVFAGIATVADGMLLYHENRPLVRNAVSICKMFYTDDSDDFLLRCITGCDVYRRAFSGLSLLLDMFVANEKIRSANDITESFFGYYLVPMFNSVKRMNADISRAYGVFFGSDPDSDVTYLFELNEKRKTTVAAYMDELSSREQPYAPFIYHSDAPAGILGLLAQNMMLLNDGIPCIVLHPEDDGTYHGSGRSPVWYPCLTRLLEHCPYVSGGGHDTAFGICLSCDNDVAALFSFLEQDVASFFATVSDSAIEAKPDFVIATDGSGDVGLDILLFFDYLRELELYRPFGKGFAEPDILLQFHASDRVSWQLIGSEKQHLKITLAFGFSVLVWNAADKLVLQNSDQMLSLRGSLHLNRYNDTVSVNFMGDFISDTVLSEEAPA